MTLEPLTLEQRRAMTPEQRAERLRAETDAALERHATYFRTHARVSGLSLSREYVLDWNTRLATFSAEVPTEAHSLSLPTQSAVRNGDSLVLQGTEPYRGKVFTIVADSERRAIASGKLNGAIVSKVGPKSWTCQRCGRDLWGKDAAELHGRACNGRATC